MVHNPITQCYIFNVTRCTPCCTAIRGPAASADGVAHARDVGIYDGRARENCRRKRENCWRRDLFALKTDELRGEREGQFIVIIILCVRAASENGAIGKTHRFLGRQHIPYGSKNCPAENKSELIEFEYCNYYLRLTCTTSLGRLYSVEKKLRYTTCVRLSMTRKWKV